MTTPTLIEQIEEEFDETFSHRKYLGVSPKYSRETASEIKTFLHSALLRVREETLKEVREKAEKISWNVGDRLSPDNVVTLSLLITDLKE